MVSTARRPGHDAGADRLIPVGAVDMAREARQYCSHVVSEIDPTVQGEVVPQMVGAGQSNGSGEHRRPVSQSVDVFGRDREGILHAGKDTSESRM